MAIVTITKTQVWDGRAAGKTIADLIAEKDDSIKVAPEDMQFLEKTFGPACRGWSQLIAWSWLDQTVLFSDDNDDLKLAESLQAEFQAEITKQAQEDSKAGSNDLADYLSGLEEKMKPLLAKLGFSIGMSKVFDANFGNHFYLKVDDSYEGYFSFDPEKQYNGKKPKITLGLAYPSRTHLYLEWMNDTSNQEEPPAYLPTGTF
jgi:hypothetical protein